MIRQRALSPIARTLLATLADVGDGWSYGYDLCRQAGIKSGSLYPLLIRLESQGYLEAQWQPPAEPGRPPRHAYRLTAAGVRLARDNPVTTPQLAAQKLSGKPA
jgi:PadR family transcriptional regulator PadR